MAFFSMIKTLLLCAASLTALLATHASGQSYNHFLSGERLNTGQYLIQGRDKFIIQNDCNLVLYSHGTPIWASNTGGLASGCYLAMQTDGNLVVYDYGNRAIWASNTGGENGYYNLILQKDGNVVIYGKPIWATGTSYSGSAVVVVTAARNGTVWPSGAEQNKVKEMGKIVQVLGDE
ncbi:hypothetical protein M5K25_006347 [Dendrobium thyrsiflorum]|uniref:Bulb-type lectin domain-containing protein n=1 Tax=Dendrobium thyrsiflorum TaxID=117978 RepID=A0ABD0VBJ1_DENTH